MCVHPEAINNQWCDMDPYDWLNKFYRFYLVAVVSIISRCGLRIDVHCRNQCNKSKLALYKLLIHFHLYTITSKQSNNCALMTWCGYKTGGKQRFIFLVLLESDHMSCFACLDYRLSLSILKIQVCISYELSLTLNVLSNWLGCARIFGCGSMYNCCYLAASTLSDTAVSWLYYSC